MYFEPSLPFSKPQPQSLPYSIGPGSARAFDLGGVVCAELPNHFNFILLFAVFFRKSTLHINTHNWTDNLFCLSWTKTKE